jgi:hypothetical protein
MLLSMRRGRDAAVGSYGDERKLPRFALSRIRSGVVAARVSARGRYASSTSPSERARATASDLEEASSLR